MSNRTIQENLSLLQQTRQNISDALSGKGATVTGAFSTFPNKVKGLNQVNEFMSSLMNRSVSMNNPVIDAASSQRKTIKPYAFYECSGLTGSLVIGDNISSIGQFSFSGCSGFNGTLTIGKGVTTIGSSAFTNCSKFTGSLVIPDLVTSIGTGAFNRCSGFNGTLTIGTGVTRINNAAFSNIPNLQSMTILATTPPTLGNATNSLGSTAYTYPIYVPAGSLSEYKNKYTAYAQRIYAIP